MAHVTLSHTLTNGTPADASEVQENFIDITDQVNGNLDYTNLSESAAIKGTQLSTTYRIPTDRIADKAVDKDKLKDDTDPGSPLAAVNSSAHIKDGIVTKAKISGKLSLAQLEITRTVTAFNWGAYPAAVDGFPSLTPFVVTSGGVFVVKMTGIMHQSGATPLAQQTVQTIVTTAISAATSVVLGVYLEEVSYSDVTERLTGNVVLVTATLT